MPKPKEELNGKIVVLGLQHTFVMFGATILVPIMIPYALGEIMVAGLLYLAAAAVFDNCIKRKK